MRIVIRTLPHSQQRYDTCGDWFNEAGTLCVMVSQLGNQREELLVAIHELVEAVLCIQKGISVEAVDSWDLEFNGQGEPGDHPAAPYHRQHQIATIIERLLAMEMGVDWKTYEDHIDQLSNTGELSNE